MESCRHDARDCTITRLITFLLSFSFEMTLAQLEEASSRQRQRTKGPEPSRAAEATAGWGGGPNRSPRDRLDHTDSPRRDKGGRGRHPRAKSDLAIQCGGTKGRHRHDIAPRGWSCAQPARTLDVPARPGPAATASSRCAAVRCGAAAAERVRLAEGGDATAAIARHVAAAFARRRRRRRPVSPRLPRPTRPPCNRLSPSIQHSS